MDAINWYTAGDQALIHAHHRSQSLITSLSSGTRKARLRRLKTPYAPSLAAREVVRLASAKT
jgi:ribosomal protein S11